MSSKHTRAAIVALFASLVLLPSLYGTPIFDDSRFLFDNEIITAEGAPWIFWSSVTTDYWPVSYTVFWLERTLFAEYYLGYHLVNLVLHACTSVVAFYVLRALDLEQAFWGALFFAVHPVNIEAAAWMFQVKTLLAACAGMITLLLYLRFLETGVERYRLAALILFALGLLAKTSIVTLPILLVLLPLMQKLRVAAHGLRPLVMQKRAIAESSRRALPFFVVALLLGLLAVWFQQQHYTEAARDIGWLARIATLPLLHGFYVAKALLPVSLSFVYPVTDATVVTSVAAWLGLVAFGALAILAWKLRIAMGFGLVFHAVLLFPALGLLDIPFMQFSLVADHWQYPALLGLTAIVPVLLARLLHGTARTALLLIILSLLIGASLMRSGLFRDEIDLLSDAAAKGDSAFVQIRLGLAKKQQLAAAAEHFERAMALAPDAPHAPHHLANIRFEQQRVVEAETLYRKAIARDPDYAEAHFNLANILLNVDRKEEAELHYRRALKDDEVAKRYVAMVESLLLKNALTQALFLLRLAHREKPNHVAIRLHFGLTSLRLNQLADAETALKKAISIHPGLAEAHFGLGKLYLQREDQKQARVHLEAVLQLSQPEEPIHEAAKAALGGGR